MAPHGIRFKHSVITIFIFLALLWLQWHWRNRIIYRASYGLPPLRQMIPGQIVDTEAQIRLWRALEHLLTSNPPGIPRPAQSGSIPEIKYQVQEHAFQEMISMSDEQVASMKEGHGGFVKGLSVHQLHPVYNKRTRGIVCTAGGGYLPLVVITLRLLARLGSTLPMEVFLEAGAEYESHICEVILPILNARCVILGEILNAAPHPRQIGRFQLKIFSIMFSSFEEVLFLDADSLPIQDPLRLFESEPFKSKGLVLWPDFWYPTPSKYFFDIAGISQPSNALRQATESGQLLISKKTHWKTLLMAAYYNYWGPDHYYPLLAQGGAGEGDKETFIPAARVVSEPFYQVTEKVAAIGNGDPNTDAMLGNAMLQFDPIEDYRLTSKGIYRTTRPSAEHSPKPFFIHINLIKFNPKQIYDDKLIMRWPNGSYRRAWTKPEVVMDLLDIDAERMYFEEAKWAACNLMHRFRDWYGKDDICRKAKEHWEIMYSGERS
ncbi:MAG: hypothetical protein GOMPHAMPRED_007143 [Gomphillus americanus]|uniref:Alpha-1,2-mannosyltransferase n=1 Tax=Gomphillus americanus TaxID=1940652 RepID=A0A8H3IYN4_9LECA|nr:MAG: hypothetical protein GOMPHAMPRED_007143 [Gomphillus americanus]